jgi:hypothetical protein
MLDALLNALNYAGSSLDKLGPRPLRGLLGGKPHELASIIPFSDTAGLTNPADAVTGRDLTNKWGLTDPSDKGWGAWGAGVGTEALLDPLALFGAAKGGIKALGGLSRAMKPSTVNPVHHLAGLLGDAGAASRASRDLSPMEHALWAHDARRGALGLKYDPPPERLKAEIEYFDRHGRPMYRDPLQDSAGEFGLARHDPEWVNNRTFYHGSGTPGLTAEMLDPMKTAPENLFGRGIYTTADEGLGRSYLNKGITSRSQDLLGQLNEGEFIDRAHERLIRGEFDPFLARHRPHSLEGLNPQHRLSMLMEMAKSGARGPHSILGGGEASEEALRLLLPEATSPRPTLYQGQSSFGKILDVDEPLAGGPYREIYEALVSALKQAGVPNWQVSDALHWQRPGAIARTEPRSIAQLLKVVQPLNNVARGADPVLRGLREAGYDAMTHTGGVRAGGGNLLHQVLIGLDPNDVLGLGRKTPYQRWEPLR